LLTRRCGGRLPQCAAGQGRYSDRRDLAFVVRSGNTQEVRSARAHGWAEAWKE